MNFLGLPLGTLVGVLGAVGAATVVLYILKLRRRALSVPFVALWRNAIAEKQASRLFSQLKRWLSLLLQLLMVGLLVLALGDPRFEGALRDARNIVVIMDASASMKATDVRQSRVEAAKQRVHDLVRGLGPDDRMLVAQMDATVTPLSPLSSDLGLLHQAVDAMQATDSSADLEAALLFARDTLRGNGNAEIILVSDGALRGVEQLSAPAQGEPTVSYVGVGQEHDNVAITQFSVRRYPLDRSRAEAMLELSNLMERPVQVDLTLLGDGDVVDHTRLQLGPKENLSRFYDELAGVDRTLEARIQVLDGTDWLPADDRAFALVPERRRAKVVVFSPGNTYLEAALLLDEYLEVTWVDAKDAAHVEGNFDVAIADGVLPPVELRVGGTVYLDTPEGAPIQRGQGITDFGFDQWERNDPTVRYIALENVQVTEGFALKPEPGDKVIGRSDQGPILVSGVREGRSFVALGFDPRDSDIVLRPAWPLLLLNCIDSFAPEESRYLSSYKTGTSWRLPIPAQIERVDLRTPTGRVEHLQVRQGALTLLGRDAGFYTLSAAGDAQQFELQLAANLSDVQESHITPTPDASAALNKLPAPSGFVRGARQQVWGYLLLVVFALSLVEWFTYHRRVSV